MTPPSTSRAIIIVGRGVFIELMRRKEIYVLSVFMLFHLAGVFVAATLGVEDASSATFMINLGMAFAHAGAHILTLMTAARQIPDEIETRSIHPMLARPLGRGCYLAGKWLAVSAAGAFALGIFLFMVALSMLFIHQSHPLSPPLLAETVLLLVISLALTAALAMLGSLLLPRGVNLVLVGLLVFAGNALIGFLRARMMQVGARGLGDWLTAYIPNFGNLNLINRYTDGLGPVDAAQFAGLVFHGVIFTAVALLAASALFRRRPL